MMKKLLTLLAIAIFIQLDAKATHIAGADITYSCTATPGIFKVTLVIYRDCQGIPLCSGSCTAQCPQTIIMKSADPGCSSLNQTISCQLVNVRDANPEPLCPTATNICSNLNCKIPGTFAPAFERYQFEGFVNLGPTSGIPATCCNISLAWELCCRNSTINTGPANQNFYTNAIINRCLSTTPCNSSPNLYYDPITYICDYAVINYGAVDPDGDSLSFAFAPALVANGTSAPYTPPYSFDKPMPWTGSPTAPFPAGIRCDPFTGDILFATHNLSGTYFTGVMAIEIKQWRTIAGSPTIMGITRRDAQMVLLPDCQPNNIPSLITNPPEASNPTKPRLNWQVCPGQQLCFTVTAKDTDVALPTLSDTTRISWDTALIALGATFEPLYSHSEAQRDTLGPREDEWRFCWTPTASQARKEPYLFTITAKDSRCPVPGKATSGFTIQVGNPKTQIPLAINKVNHGCNNWSFNFQNSLSAGTMVRWEITRNSGDSGFNGPIDTFNNRSSTPSLLFQQAGIYPIRVIVRDTAASFCDVVYTDTLIVPTNSVAINTAFTDSTTCSGNAIRLSAQTSTGKSPFTYRWFTSLTDTNSTHLNSDSTISEFIVVPTKSQSYIVQVRDSFGCRNYDSTSIKVGGELTRLTTSNLSCNSQNDGSILALNNTPFNYSYQLNGGSFTSNGSFQNLPAGNYALTVFDSTNNCTFVYAAITVAQPTPIKDTLVLVKPETCRGFANASIIANATGGKPPYRFSLDSVTFVSTDLFTGLNPGTYIIHILDTGNCYASFTSIIPAIDSLKIQQITTTNPSCFNKANGSIRINAIGGTQPYRYAIGLNPFGADSIFNNLTGGNYTIQIADSNNCILTSNTTLTNPLPIAINSITGVNSTTDGKIETYSMMPTGSGLSYAWAVSKQGTIIGANNTTSVNIRWDSVGTGTVKAFIFQNTSCVDSTSFAVNVSPSVGIGEIETALGIRVYPNPTYQSLHIVLNQLPEYPILKLFDMNGKLIFEQPLTLNQSIDLTALPKGVYVLQIGQWHKKVLKN